METGTTLRPGDTSTRKRIERYGERFVCVRHCYDAVAGRRYKTKFGSMLVSVLLFPAATAERHPNSHQRTVALSGTALFEVFIDGSWSPRPASGGEGESQHARAVSIPPSVWRRIRIGPQNFVSVSFHTVPPDQLIEETPIGNDLSNTTQRLYHA